MTDAPAIPKLPVRELPAPEERAQPSKKIVGELLKRQGGLCAICSVVLAKINQGRVFICAPFDVDHVAPLDQLGDNAPENLQCLCVPCHREKTKADIAVIAKGRRIRGETGQLARRRKHGPTIKKPPGYISPLSSKHPRYRS